MDSEPVSAIDFEKNGGLVPVVAQEYSTGRVLMVAYMNREAFAETLSSGRACYYSRSRRKLWRKGEESGNYQVVHEVKIDCDGDVLLLSVEPRGDAVACHEGYLSCFFRTLKAGRWKISEPRKVDPAKYGPGYGHAKKPAL